MKLAIVGLGKIAKCQIEAIRTGSADIQIVAGCDTNQERASILEGAAFYSSIETLLDTARPDVILVSTPSEHHYKNALTILEKQQSLLLEKPACESLEELNHLVELARNQNVHFDVAFHAAFAKEVEWWVAHRDALKDRYGPLKEILMGFFDPYIKEDGTVLYADLGGSWFDGGINALSVLGRIADPATIRIDGARIFSSPYIPVRQARASMQLSFPVGPGRCDVTIDTSWLLGISRKTTMLAYERATVILNHSTQEVVVRSGTGDVESIDLSGGRDRLINHYVGVFNDMKRRYEERISNIGHAFQLHNLLFKAIEMAREHGVP